jgi:endonuclease G
MHSWYNGSVDRSNAWNYDPYISHSKQPDLSSSYKSNGDGSFSRGHMVASSDRLRTTALNKQTFYFTNMSPQTQNSFNGGIWEKLEKKVLAWGDDTSDTLYVVSGTAFIGTLKTVKDNNGKVLPVPSNYYKVLLSSKSGKTGKSIGQLSASELKCVGFWLDHFGHSNTDKPSASDMMSVADIEAKTGFTFFPMLSESAKSVKENYKASDWGM